MKYRIQTNKVYEVEEEDLSSTLSSINLINESIIRIIPLVEAEN